MAAAVGILREAVIFIPVIVTMATLFRLKGVWLSLPIADVFASLLTSVLIVKEIKELNIKMEKNTMGKILN